LSASRTDTNQFEKSIPMNNVAILELLSEIRIAEQLASKDKLSAKEEREYTTALAKISLLKQGVTSQQIAEARTEMWRKSAGLRGEYRPTLTVEESRKITPLFLEYLRTMPESNDPTEDRLEYEKRATVLLGRPISQTYSGTDGGTLVPLEFSENFFLGLAQYSPLLDENVVTLEKSPTYALKSSVAAEWDLSQFAAQRVGAPSGDGDAVQFVGQNVPLTQANLLTGYIYKCALNATLELFQDDERLMERVAKAYAIGFARGIGVDLATGDGIHDQPQGIITGAALSSPAVVIGTGNEAAGNQSAGSITAQDLLNVFFSVNKVYRASPKCAWVMSDGVYQRIRNSVDNVGRPLLDFRDDYEVLLGKRVYIDPNFSGGGGDTSPAIAGQVVFGDLSYFRVRVSALSISKVAELSGGIEQGVFQLIGRQRANSVVVDPTNGAYPPIVSATVNA
jgi:HK97 family phage major capsid protein